MKKIHLVFSFLFITISCFSQTIEYETISNIPYYDAETIKGDEYIKERCVLDLYYPKNKTNFSTIVWFHGGGITGGSKEIPAALKEKGMAVIGVNYRLSPKAKSPAYVEDTAAAVAWAFNNIKKYGGDSSSIFLSGHSAGGYLITMVGLDKKYLAKHNIDANDIAGLIPFSGHMITHMTVRKEQGIDILKPTIDEMAPLFHVRADAPPLLLITGDRDMELLGRYEETAYMLRMMQLIGHKETELYELEGFNHGEMAYPAFPLLINEVNLINAEKEAVK